MSDTAFGLTQHPARYEIRLAGHLHSRWADRFNGMSLTARPDGTTLIYGPVIDQAALHGLLRTLFDLGLPLLSVTQVDPITPRAHDVAAAPTTEPDHSPRTSP